MLNMFVATIGVISQDLFNRAKARDFCNIDALCHLARLRRPHSARIMRKVNELELGFRLFQPTPAELAKPKNILDPAVGWLGNPLAFYVVKLVLFGL